MGEPNVSGAFWRAPPKVTNLRLVSATENVAVAPKPGVTGPQFATLAVAGGSVSVALQHTGKGIVVFTTKGGEHRYHLAPYSSSLENTGEVVATFSTPGKRVWWRSVKQASIK